MDPELAEDVRRLSQDYSVVRSQFPFFQKSSNPIFFENAGGSQIPLCVADGIKDYMLSKYVQLGAGYELSNQADENIAKARGLMTQIFNSSECGSIIMGNSTTQLVANIANCYAKFIVPGDEVIVHECCHESNAGPWVRLAAATGATLKFWEANPDTFSSSLDDLLPLLSPRTKLLAVTHVSNLLGEVLDVPALVGLVRSVCGENSCRIIVDGVAYAPHLPVDVAAWQVDWYVFSTYKTWGPHMAALYGSHSAFAELTEKCEGPNHFFVSRTAVPYKFEPGGVNHEGCAGLVALSDYLKVLARLSLETVDELEDGRPQPDPEETRPVDPDRASLLESTPPGTVSRAIVELAYKTMARLELPLQQRLIGYLITKPQVTIVGPAVADPRVRVPTISFVHATKPSPAVSSALQARGFAVRHGHMYAHRLVTRLQPRLQVPIDDGVVRLSLLHYNTPEEVELLILALDEIL